jgi:hypothetical protein
MSRIYQDFRKRVLDELKVEMPELGYRQKIKVISERWRQHKATTMTTMDADTVGETFLNDDDTGNITEELRALTHTIEVTTDTAFLQLTYKGENLVLQLCRVFLRNRPTGDRFLIGFVRRFIALGDVFYGLRLQGTYDILDLVNFYQRWEVIYHALAAAPPEWFKTASSPKLSATMGLLFVATRRDRQLTGSVINLVQKLIGEGLDPNLEIGDVICGATATASYETDPTFTGLRDRALDVGIRYSGISDVAREYRVFIRRLENTQFPVDTSALDLIGETVFSLFMRHGRNFKHRRFCEQLLKKNRINLTTIVYSSKDDETTCYQRMVFQAPSAMVTSLASFLLKETPPYMFYVKSARDPLRVLLNSQTTWDSMVLMNGGAQSAFQSIFENFLVLPDKQILRHLMMYSAFLGRVTTHYENYTPERLLSKPLPSPLVKLFLEGGGLEVFCKTEFLQPLAVDKHKTLQETASRLIVRNENEIKNTMFIFSDLKVTDELLADPLMTFVTDDNFVFHRDEFSHLLEKKQNPFNRRSLTTTELENLEFLLDTFHEWWFLYQTIPDVSSGNRDSRELMMVRRIDEIIDECPFFSYGVRLLNHYETLASKIEHVQASYLYLLSNPQVCIQGNAADGFQASCIGFHTHPLDHHSVEEINIYYGVRMTQVFSDQPPPVSVAVENLLSWIYLILDSSRAYCDQQIFIGRVITLYFVVANFLQCISRTETND